MSTTYSLPIHFQMIDVRSTSGPCDSRGRRQRSRSRLLHNRSPILSSPNAVDTAARLRAYDKERAGIRAGSPVRGDNVDADLAPGRPLVRSDVIHAEARILMGGRSRLR